MPKKLPSIDYLHKVLRCDPDTGFLYWRERTPELFSDTDKLRAEAICNRWNGRHANKRAFTCLVKGYYTGRIDSSLYFAHRIVFAMHHDKDPCFGIDHINGDPSDNRVVNLRAVAQVVNNRNAAKPKHNTSGVVGVSWEQGRQRWTACVSVENRTVHLGRFTSFADAVAARQAANKLYNFHPNHGRPPT